MKTGFPMTLQMFAESAGGSGTDPGTSAGQNQTNLPANNQNQSPTIDYEKIQQMLDGTLKAKEDTALKAYFKQQGLSQQEAEQAISAFKQQKAASQPDVNVLQQQAKQAQVEAQQAQIQAAAIMTAAGLGIDVKTIPYVLKMADLSQVIGQDGKINEETLKNALNKVLEDVPALKPQAAGAAGFQQVGAPGNGGTTGATDAELDRIFGVQKK